MKRLWTWTICTRELHGDINLSQLPIPTTLITPVPIPLFPTPSLQVASPSPPRHYCPRLSHHPVPTVLVPVPTVLVPVTTPSPLSSSPSSMSSSPSLLSSCPSPPRPHCPRPRHHPVPTVLLCITILSPLSSSPSPPRPHCPRFTMSGKFSSGSTWRLENMLVF